LGSATFQFTKFSTLDNSGFHFYNNGSSTLNSLVVQDSELYNGTNDLSGGSSTRVALLNDLFQRSSLCANDQIMRLI
jgi:ATPase subunit of ABC transporter with duplicated ATPase domains